MMMSVFILSLTIDVSVCLITHYTCQCLSYSLKLSVFAIHLYSHVSVLFFHGDVLVFVLATP